MTDPSPVVGGHDDHTTDTPTCPQCRGRVQTAIQRFRGEQEYSVESDATGVFLRPYDWRMTEPVGKVELICSDCGHQWETSRDLPRRLDGTLPADTPIGADDD